MTYTGILGYITERHLHFVAVNTFKSVIKHPPHDAHKGCIIIAVTSTYRVRKFYSSLMVTFVTCLTQGYQIVWRITAGLSALEVMDLKDLVFGSAVTASVCHFRES